MAFPLDQVQWHAGLVRISIFQDEMDATPFFASLLPAIAGDQPTKTEGQPKLGTEVQRIKWREGELRIGRGLGRLDIVLAPLVVGDQLGLPTVGDFGEERDNLIAAFERHVVPNFQRASRVAVGASVIAKRDTAADVMSLLLTLTRVDANPDQSSDFAFQINRHRQILGDVRANRICKWMSLVVTDQLTDMTPNQRVGASVETHYARIDFDYNTHPGRDLSAGEIPEALRALASLTEESLKHGDIP